MEDKEFTAKLRRVIVSHWLEVSLMRVRVVRGLVLLGGKIQKVGEGADKLKVIAATLRKLDNELRTLRGVRGVTYDFENWVQLPSGAWRPRSQEDAQELEEEEEE